MKTCRFCLNKSPNRIKTTKKQVSPTVSALTTIFSQKTSKLKKTDNLQKTTKTISTKSTTTNPLETVSITQLSGWFFPKRKIRVVRNYKPFI